MNFKRATFAIITIFTLILILYLSWQKNDKRKSNLETEKQEPKTESEVKAAKTTKELLNQPTSNNISKSSIYLGIWTQGFFDKTSNTLHPEALINLQNKIGKKVAIAHYFRGWEALDSPQLLEEFETISSNGWRPMLSVNPYFFTKCQSSGKSLYQTIALGNCDNFLKSAGENLKNFTKPLFLRFAWEMNIPSMEWQIEKTGSTNKDFVAAWQRVHDIIYAQGATNVLWVFSPDVTNTNYADFYPGDTYVDWLGLDGYNWGTTQKWNKWQSFSEIFQSAYNQITKLAPNKPLMIAEINSTDSGGDKSAWYNDLLTNQLPTFFPKIKAIVFYNEDRTKQENVNWLIDSSASYLSSFSQDIQSNTYLSSF